MMVKSGMVFTYDGKPAKTLDCLPKLDLWLCRYCDGSNLVFLFTKEIEERMKKDMKLEYKFYEKNLAPKWLEGDYDLHIEGNRMTMTSKDGKKVETRCHPDDDWRLQVGIDELKERMAEAKKPKEIKVGDKVKFKHDKTGWYYPHCVSEWCHDNAISAEYLMAAYKTDNTFTEIEYKLEDYDFVVTNMGKYSGQTLAYIYNQRCAYGLIVNTNWLKLAE